MMVMGEGGYVASSDSKSQNLKKSLMLQLVHGGLKTCSLPLVQIACLGLAEGQ